MAFQPTVPGFGIESDRTWANVWSGVRITASHVRVRLVNKNLIDGCINVVNMSLIVRVGIRRVMIKLDAMRVDGTLDTWIA